MNCKVYGVVLFEEHLFHLQRTIGRIAPFVAIFYVSLASYCVITRLLLIIISIMMMIITTSTAMST